MQQPPRPVQLLSAAAHIVLIWIIALFIRVMGLFGLLLVLGKVDILDKPHCNQRWDKHHGGSNGELLLTLSIGQVNGISFHGARGKLLRYYN